MTDHAHVLCLALAAVILWYRQHTEPCHKLAGPCQLLALRTHACPALPHNLFNYHIASDERTVLVANRCQADCLHVPELSNTIGALLNLRSSCTSLNMEQDLAVPYNFFKDLGNVPLMLVVQHMPDAWKASFACSSKHCNRIVRQSVKTLTIKDSAALAAASQFLVGRPHVLPQRFRSATAYP